VDGKHNAPGPARRQVSVRAQFLHGKAYIFRGQVRSRGRPTPRAPGLLSNLELSLAQYGPGVIGLAEQWFDVLFVEGETFTESIFVDQYFDSKRSLETTPL
jgi:hypothetical protein